MRFNANIIEAEKNETLITRSDTGVNNWTNSEETGLYLSHAVSIQRAWRSYRNSRHSIDDKSSSKGSNGRLDKDESSESDNCPQTMSLSTPDDCTQNLRLEDDLLSIDHLDHETDEVDEAEELKFEARKTRGLSYSLAVRCAIDSEPDSIVSDYSEMADPIKEHLANVQIIQKEDLDLGNAFVNNFMVQPKMFRGAEEDEEEFNKRVRKTNYLSLAQEFAELKKVNASALPFGLHKDEYKTVSPLSDGDSVLDELDGVDQCNDDSNEPKSSHEDNQLSHEIQCTDKTGVKSETERKADDCTEVREMENVEIDKKEIINSDCNPALNSDPQKDPLQCKTLSDKTEQKYEESEDKKTSVPDSAMTNHDSDNSSFTDSPVKRVKMMRKKMEDSISEFDIYTVETALPHLDWQHLEEQLQRSAEDEHRKWSHCGDREQIRRKLAMATEDDAFDSELLLRKPSLQTRLQTNMNLHMCYVNEAAEAVVGSTHDPRVGSTNDPCPTTVNPTAAASCGSTLDGVQNQTHAVAANVTSIVDPVENEDFFAKQARLQAEAKMALAQVRPMAHMQLQLEKQLKKKSPLAEIVGIPGFINGKFRHLNNYHLRQMNFAQLQVVVNDLHAQIEVLNLELMQQLVERDDLHMAQDSMLVDIEDLTGRAQEFAARVNKRTERKESFNK